MAVSKLTKVKRKIGKIMRGLFLNEVSQLLCQCQIFPDRKNLESWHCLLLNDLKKGRHYKLLYLKRHDENWQVMIGLDL